MIESHFSEINFSCNVVKVNAHVRVSLRQFVGDSLHLVEIFWQLRWDGSIGMTLSEWKVLAISIKEIEANIRLPVGGYEQCLHLPIEAEELVVLKTLAAFVLHVLLRDDAWLHTLIRPFAVLEKIVLPKALVYLPLSSLVIKGRFILTND